MGLSERERRSLAELGEDLAQHDPKLARALTAGRTAVGWGEHWLGWALLSTVGVVTFALLLAAIILAQPVPAVIAAVLVVVTAAMLGVRQLRRRSICR